MISCWLQSSILRKQRALKIIVLLNICKIVVGQLCGTPPLTAFLDTSLCVKNRIAWYCCKGMSERVKRGPLMSWSQWHACSTWQKRDAHSRCFVLWKRWLRLRGDLAMADRQLRAISKVPWRHSLKKKDDDRFWWVFFLPVCCQKSCIDLGWWPVALRETESPYYEYHTKCIV